MGIDFKSITDKIIVSGKNYEMPFSKGLLARSLTAAGMKPSEAYMVAKEIEKTLEDEGYESITKDELRKRVYYYLLTKNYESIAEKYLLWRRILKKHPIIILIGGASGVGTSTIAFELASRLGIPSVIGTDSIREVMRRSISKDLVPMLYESSYTAWKSLRIPSLDDNVCDKHILGFERHIEPVLVGIESLIDRSLTEGLSIIIEGTHIVPGFMKEKYTSMPNIITIILTLSSEKMHKKRFSARAKVSARPMERYLKNFEIIRKINQYIVDRAKENDVPIIENVSISQSVEKCLEIITERFNYLDKTENGENGEDDMY
ncbi:2-phosphoglycerate kinase [Methanothermococcus okinawensis]|uniref:2-phosphoglycerate kinase n=1 Tax=Methanothermococcus okinawensis (strain DSM 14208 / JCM 11175 / IH1) TaxID=647113 RepID=F8ANP6_METOI|nr:2-phosphoglycerate kinase [Methanothermococcus okinawensis]AEH06244.1 2-phosphoglycerate kinase [Methanothermococcus okinawensis IH1]